MPHRSVKEEKLRLLILLQRFIFLSKFLVSVNERQIFMFSVNLDFSNFARSTIVRTVRPESC